MFASSLGPLWLKVMIGMFLLMFYSSYYCYLLLINDALLCLLRSLL